MNLHAIVASQIGGVNPFVSATIRRAVGYTTASDGSRTPQYTDISVSVQVQALSFSDLQKLDGQNIQGVRRAIYLSGNVMAVVRAREHGGDLILFPSGTLPEGDTWLAAMVLEQWPDWVKVAITLQNDG